MAQGVDHEDLAQSAGVAVVVGEVTQTVVAGGVAPARFLQDLAACVVAEDLVLETVGPAPRNTRSGAISCDLAVVSRISITTLAKEIIVHDAGGLQLRPLTTIHSRGERRFF